MNGIFNIVYICFLLLSACTDTEYEVSHLEVGKAKKCLEIQKSRHDVEMRMSSLISSNNLAEKDLVSLVNIFEEEIESKNQCLRMHADPILKMDGLSVEFSQYLSDISSARSLITVEMDQGHVRDGGRIHEVLNIALKHISAVDD